MQKYENLQIATEFDKVNFFQVLLKSYSKEFIKGFKSHFDGRFKL